MYEPSMYSSLKKLASLYPLLFAGYPIRFVLKKNWIEASKARISIESNPIKNIYFITNGYFSIKYETSKQ